MARVLPDSWLDSSRSTGLVGMKMPTQIMNIPPPTEKAEQIVLRQYLDLKDLPYFRVPNETWTNSYNQKRLNKALGVKSGVPDMFVCVNGQVVAIELKRTKGGTVSVAQKYWIKTLNEHGLTAIVCKGANQAIDFIEKLIKLNQ